MNFFLSHNSSSNSNKKLFALAHLRTYALKAYHKVTVSLQKGRNDDLSMSQQRGLPVTRTFLPPHPPPPPPLCPLSTMLMRKLATCATFTKEDLNEFVGFAHVWPYYKSVIGNARLSTNNGLWLCPFVIGQYQLNITRPF